MTTLRDRFTRAGGWLFDLLAGKPEGQGRYLNTASKEGLAIPFAVLAFVATQTGALALVDQLNIAWQYALAVYIGLCLCAIGLLCIVLRLKADTPYDADIYYFDRASILFGKFVLIVCIFATIAFSFAYVNGVFSPRIPYRRTSIPLSPPIPLTRLANSNAIFGNEFISQNDAGSFRTFATAISDGLRQGRTNGDVYACWTLSAFDKNYDDFRCETFEELPNPADALVFLHTSYPTKFGGTQFSLRQLFFELSPNRFPTRNFVVQSPLEGDRVVVLFWASTVPQSKTLQLAVH
jgi:hypothetical protein